jgi:hypothetical protein
VKRLLVVSLVAACGDNVHVPPLFYHAPGDGKLRLVRDDAASTGTAIVFDFVVGDAPLTGYSTGFDLRIDATKATVGKFTPGTALDPGTGMPAANAVIATTGPLASQLVAVQSQKATSSPGDATLQPGAVLFAIELDAVQPLVAGIVFDGKTDITSAGLHDRLGTTVVDVPDVAIGKLEVIPPP